MDETCKELIRTVEATKPGDDVHIQHIQARSWGYPDSMPQRTPDRWKWEIWLTIDSQDGVRKQRLLTRRQARALRRRFSYRLRNA